MTQPGDDTFRSQTNATTAPSPASISPPNPTPVLPASDVIPPANLASPVEGSWLNEPGIPFWTPTWRDVWRQMGWNRLLVVLIAVGFAGLVFLFVAWPMQMLNFIVIGGKLTILAICIPIAMVTKAIRAAVKTRQDLFCIHCGYGLSGLPDHHRCPECGRPYSFALIEEYRRDPHWFIERCKAHRILPAQPQGFAAGPVRRKGKSRDGT